MKICVVGAGSIGTLLAALLAKSKEEIWLLSNNDRAADKINSQGIRVEGIAGSWQARVNASSDSRRLQGCDLVVICVKSYDTASAARTIKPMVGDNTYVLTLQNGMGNCEILQDAVGPEKVFAGITTLGAVRLDAGKVRYTGKGEIVIGRPDGAIPVIMRSVRELFNRSSGIETKISRDIKGSLWSKLLINAAINPLTAITRLHNGGLMEFKETRELMRHAVTECVKIAKRKRIKLIYDDPLAKVEAVCESSSANLSSMLQDVLKQKRTEIDAITGFIVRQGEELGIPVPVNTVLLNLVKTIEASYGKAMRDK